MEKEYKKNDNVRYVGAGFVGFDETKRTMKFEMTHGENSAIVNYRGTQMVVKMDEIEAILPDTTNVRVRMPDHSFIKIKAATLGCSMQDVVSLMVAGWTDK